MGWLGYRFRTSHLDDSSPEAVNDAGSLRLGSASLPLLVTLSLACGSLWPASAHRHVRRLEGLIVTDGVVVVSGLRPIDRLGLILPARPVFSPCLVSLAEEWEGVLHPGLVVAVEASLVSAS